MWARNSPLKPRTPTGRRYPVPFSVVLAVIPVLRDWAPLEQNTRTVRLLATHWNGYNPPNTQFFAPMNFTYTALTDPSCPLRIVRTRSSLGLAEFLNNTRLEPSLVVPLRPVDVHVAVALLVLSRGFGDFLWVFRIVWFLPPDKLLLTMEEIGFVVNWNKLSTETVIVSLLPNSQVVFL